MCSQDAPLSSIPLWRNYEYLLTRHDRGLHCHRGFVDFDDRQIDDGHYARTQSSAHAVQHGPRADGYAGHSDGRFGSFTS
jgi:hypothetical protein